MGRINCAKHGLAGITLVCPHIKDNVLKSLTLNRKSILSLTIDILGDGEFTMQRYFCTICVHIYKLPTDGSTLSSEDFENYVGRENVAEPVCSECFKETLN